VCVCFPVIFAKFTNCSLLDYRWKYEFVKDIVSDILEQTLTAEAPQYKTILDLDRKIREKVLPPHLNVFMNPEEERFTPSVYMRSCILGQFRAVSRCLFLFPRFADFVSNFTYSFVVHPQKLVRPGNVGLSLQSIKESLCTIFLGSISMRIRRYQ
jgi:hypothetical protein